jgi:hypothetical protein
MTLAGVRYCARDRKRGPCANLFAISLNRARVQRCPSQSGARVSMGRTRPAHGAVTLA